MSGRRRHAIWTRTPPGDVVVRMDEQVVGTGGVHDAGRERHLTDLFVQLAESVEIGRALMLDFTHLKSALGPYLLEQVVSRLQESSTRRKRGLLRGRYLVLKNPGPDVLSAFEWVARRKHASVIAVQDRGKGPAQIHVLGLPQFLKETLAIIGREGRVTSAGLARMLGPTKGASARERLRQLHRRGLVRRTPLNDASTERLSYAYEVFDPHRRL